MGGLIYNTLRDTSIESVGDIFLLNRLEHQALKRHGHHHRPSPMHFRVEKCASKCVKRVEPNTN